MMHMKKMILSTILLICVLSSATVYSVWAQSESAVGVETGDNFTYSFNVTWVSTNPEMPVPEEFSDLLLLPRPEIESLLKQGQTVFKQGKVRGMNVFLLATPTFEDMGKEFRRLIAEGKFTLDKEAAAK